MLENQANTCPWDGVKTSAGTIYAAQVGAVLIYVTWTGDTKGGDMSSVIAAFSEEHVQRLTGVTKHQLRYWDTTDFFSPSYAGGEWDQSIARLYSFQDVLALRVLNLLRNKHGVPLPHLRDVALKLSKSPENRWTGVRLYVLKKRVVWNEPETARPQEVVSGQFVVPEVIVSDVASDLRQDIKSLNRRDEHTIGRIEKGRKVNRNAEVIAGTRVRVSAIRRFSDAGYTVDQILQEYPDLAEQDVVAALNHGETRAAA
jgi:DNA-binding transcriptional MerR regulator